MATTATELGYAEREISTGELSRRLGEVGLAVVDVRPLPRFNGWRGPGEARGGHVPGAVALPAEWLSRLSDGDLRSFLADKGIAASEEVVVYGDGEDVSLPRPACRARRRDGAEPRRRLAGVGRRRVCPGRATTATTSGSSIPRGSRELLAGGRRRPRPRGGSSSSTSTSACRRSTPTAIFPAPSTSTPTCSRARVDWNRRSPEELDAALRALGITADTTVILYGRDTEGEANEKWPGRRAGQIAATRAALILSYAGVEDVRLLDGGYDAWVQSGRGIEEAPRVPHSVPSFGAEIPVRPDLIVDIDDAKRILADRDGGALVSVRTWNEHVGQVSGYNYIQPAGRIAGDVWGNCGTDAYHMQHYRNLDNTMRPYPEIAANWADAGITPDKWVAFYCGTGWRASETWLYAYLMGWPRIAVYDGGWWEWSANPAENPIELGEPAS